MMRTALLACLLLLHGALLPAAETPRVRPAEWAQPVIGTSLDNCYRVSADLYRSEQPDQRDLPVLKALGIRSVVSLYEFFPDPRAFEQAGFQLFRHRMAAGSVTEEDLRRVLASIRAAPKPVLVHCWHGSDRTGAVVAAYRIAFQGWTQEQAIDELVNGGYGFHAATYPNIVQLIRSLDVEKLKQIAASVAP
jgi:tyrosine-protein phosphatase SIW14